MVRKEEHESEGRTAELEQASMQSARRAMDLSREALDHLQKGMTGLLSAAVSLPAAIGLGAASGALYLSAIGERVAKVMRTQSDGSVAEPRRSDGGEREAARPERGRQPTRPEPPLA